MYRSMNMARILVVLILPAALVLAACTPQNIPATGKPSEPTHTAQIVQEEPTATQPAPAETPTAVAPTAPPAFTSTVPPSPTPTSTSAVQESAGQVKAAVSIANGRFGPKELTVKAGTKVVWTLNSGIHTATSDDGVFNSGTMEAGQTFEFVFDKPGVYAYYCEIHGGPGGEGMAGVIIVEE